VLYKKWFGIFADNLPPVLLLEDGHSSHNYFNLLSLKKLESEPFTYFISLHIQLLQPLDVGVFKREFEVEGRMWKKLEREKRKKSK